VAIRREVFDRDPATLRVDAAPRHSSGGPVKRVQIGRAQNRIS
jgi:hypothetical protein